jgi:hypothetical protein
MILSGLHQELAVEGTLLSDYGFCTEGGRGEGGGGEGVPKGGQYAWCMVSIG